MYKKKHGKLHFIIGGFPKSSRFLLTSIILLMIPIGYLLVYETGGIKFVYSHIMYIPIVLAGLLLGWKTGIVISLISGILLGPFMPLDVVTGEPQSLMNWMFRTFLYMIVGFVTGYISDLLREDKELLAESYSKNTETNIPNINSLDKFNYQEHENDKLIAITIILNNHRHVFEILGVTNYNLLLENIYKILSDSLKDIVSIIQAESSKLWLIKKTSNCEQDLSVLYELVSNPVYINNVSVYVDFTIGGVEIEEHKKVSFMNYFQKSDIAAFNAIKTNRLYEMYREEINVKKYDFSLLAQFKEAIVQDQLMLVYQPKIDLNQNKISSFEALLRWHHPERGMIPPDKIIPMVEQTHIIHDLTYWVLKKAVSKVLEFKRENIDIRISINISVKNLSNPNFYDNVMNIINEGKISCKNIEFEITESSLMENPEENVKTIYKFRKKGIITTIDDFGVGYSSLSYMTKLPIDKIKIDKCFINELNQNSSSKHIVKGTIDIAHNLGLKVVAEGIEYKEIVDILKQFNCDFGQGYYYSVPLPSNETIEWYKKYNNK